MNPNHQSLVRRLRDDERGQSLVLAAVLLSGLLFFAAFGIDIGNLYVSYQELLAATQAAAVAGAAAIPNANLTATTVATQYSAVAGNLNANHPNLRSVTMVTDSLTCLTTSGLPACFPPASSPTSASVNAIVVTESAQVPMFFARYFGVNYLTITATATAVTAGGTYGTYKPYNIMMVLDTTNSMTTNDADCGNISQEACAQGGIRTLLSELDPCSATLAKCPTAVKGSVPAPDDVFGLMVFPGLCSSTNSNVTTANCPTVTTGLTTPPAVNTTYAPDDYACPPTAPPIAAYNNNPAYLVLPFQSDYRQGDAPSYGLYPSSNMVIAVGGGCSTGVQAPGREGTFYAGAIAAATSYLTNTTSNPRANTVQNVLILLSDGNANAGQTTSHMAGSTTSYSLYNECAAAVSAAAAAKTAGILVYSVSYGSETTGCPTDCATNNVNCPAPTMTPCQTMQEIASMPNGTTSAPSEYFFSNANSSGTTVCSGARPSASLSQAFQEIAGDLTTARVVPNGTN